MKKKKVLIIGAGPAGLFAALTLAKKNKFEITIFDQGPGMKRRLKNKNGVIGLGGAGLFSDGKLNFSLDIGTNLGEIISPKDHKALVDEVENVFAKYGKMDFSESKEIEKSRKGLEKAAAKKGIKFLPTKMAHIGSDFLPEIINELINDLRKQGVRFVSETQIDSIKKNKIFANKKEYIYDYLILAPGRGGALWLETVARNIGIEYKYNPLDIGVRVEVSSEIMEDVCQIEYDPKFHIRTPTYDDQIRTFCTCPRGYIATEEHKNFILVNGYSNRGKKSENTNYAFLVKVNLTEPLENTNLYGQAIAQEITTIGGGKPILQRLGDLCSGQRSSWSRINKSHLKPSLIDVTPGDIAMGMPYRFVKDILEGLKILNKLIPGVADNGTLLYAPEVKLHGLKVLTDDLLQTNIENIFVAGDGAGLSRGIVGAATSGLLVAQGILKK